MATISKRIGIRGEIKWRAQVYVSGRRDSKVCATRPAAVAWAREREVLLKKQEERHRAWQGVPKDGEDLHLTAVPKRVLEAIRAVPYSLEEVLDAAIPCPASTGIYFLIKDWDVAYVGQSVDFMSRLSRHRRDGRDFDAYAFMPCSSEDLDKVESKYITAFVPFLNATLGSKRSQPLPEDPEPSL